MSKSSLKNQSILVECRQSDKEEPKELIEVNGIRITVRKQRKMVFQLVFISHQNEPSQISLIRCIERVMELKFQFGKVRIL